MVGSCGIKCHRASPSYDHIVSSGQAHLNARALANAREVGEKVGRVWIDPGEGKIGWREAESLLAASLPALLRVAVPTTRWWWWATCACLLAAIGLIGALEDSPLTGLFGLGFLVGLVVSLRQEWVLMLKREAASRALLDEVRAVSNAILEQRVSELQRQEEEEEARRKARARRRQLRRRHAALKTGIPPELIDPPKATSDWISPRDAERLVAQWIRALGEPSAGVTSFVADGGVDVVSDNYLAQVKHYQGKVGPAAIRELVGVCKVDGRKPLFFTSGSYTASAIGFADSSEVALFIYNASEGTLVSANSHAEGILNHGL